MDITEIKEALQPFVNSGSQWAQNDLLMFIQNALGYDLDKDVESKKLTPPVQTPQGVDFNSKIKFVAALPSSDNMSIEELKQWVLNQALAAPTNVVMLHQADKIIFYSVDWEDGNWLVDTLVEVNLAKDDPEEVAQQLWPLAKKDCGRKIWVGI